MKLEHAFDVRAPPERVWEALVDVEQVAPCLPGARILDVDEHGAYHGEFSVKLGPVTAAYRGKLTLAEADASTRRSTIDASGQEKRGQGTAKATIVSIVRGDGELSHVRVETELVITGRLARFGRGGILVDVSDRLLRDFAACLREALERAPADVAAPGTADAAVPPAPAEAAARPRPADAAALGASTPESASLEAGPPPPRLLPRAVRSVGAEGRPVSGVALLLGALGQRLRRVAGPVLERLRRASVVRRR